MALEQTLLTIEPINEALPKSVGERISRRTRKVSSHGGIKPEPVIKRDADNDPRQTSRGRANLKGSRKRNADEKKRRHPEKFTEHIEFIKAMVEQPADIIIEHAKKLGDPIVTLDILNGLLQRNIRDKDKIRAVYDTLTCYVEGRGYEYGPYVSKLDDEISEGAAVGLAKDIAIKVKRYLPEVWIERRPNDRTKICTYTVIGETILGERYKCALNDGCVRFV